MTTEQVFKIGTNELLTPVLTFSLVGCQVFVFVFFAHAKTQIQTCVQPDYSRLKMPPFAQALIPSKNKVTPCPKYIPQFKINDHNLFLRHPQYFFDSKNILPKMS